MRVEFDWPLCRWDHFQYTDAMWLHPFPFLNGIEAHFKGVAWGGGGGWKILARPLHRVTLMPPSKFYRMLFTCSLFLLHSRWEAWSVRTGRLKWRKFVFQLLYKHGISAGILPSIPYAEILAYSFSTAFLFHAVRKPYFHTWGVLLCKE